MCVAEFSQNFGTNSFWIWRCFWNSSNVPLVSLSVCEGGRCVDGSTSERRVGVKFWHPSIIHPQYFFIFYQTFHRYYDTRPCKRSCSSVVTSERTFASCVLKSGAWLQMCWINYGVSTLIPRPLKIFEFALLAELQVIGWVDWAWSSLSFDIWQQKKVTLEFWKSVFSRILWHFVKSKTHIQSNFENTS